MKRHGLIAVLLSLLLAVTWTASPVGADPGEKAQGIGQWLKRMTLEEKVGQMMMVGFYGSEPTSDIRRLIEESHAGSVILFAYSDNIQTPDQTARLNNGLQEIASGTRLGIPLLIATDQEGGVVARMTAGATELPGNMALGAGRDPEGAYRAAQLTAKELRAVGIQMNLAPVLDVNVNPDNPVIGVRSYGESPRLVSEMGAAAVKGYQKNGVIATAKHFPGHGDTDVDSHLGLPVIDKSRAELEKTEFVPFRRAVKEGIDAIMTAHIHIPALDDTPNLPATLSKPILTGLLRKEMGFQGLIVTDSMTMSGVADYFGGVPKAAVKAVDAGADMILLTPSLSAQEQIEVFEAIVDAVRSGEISEKRIDRSVHRILQKKKKYHLFDERMVDVDQLPKRVGTPEHREIARDLANRSITLVKNEQDLLPLKLKKGQRLGIISPYSLRDRVNAYHADTSEVLVKANPTDDQIRQAVEMAKGQDVLLVGTTSSHLDPQQVKLVKALGELDKPLVAIAFRNPYDIKDYSDVDAYMTAYGFNSVSLDAVVDTLFGVNPPRGKLPVTIPGLYEYGWGLDYRQ